MPSGTTLLADFGVDFEIFAVRFLALVLALAIIFAISISPIPRISENDIGL